MYNSVFRLSLNIFSSETSANSSQTAGLGAVAGQLEDALIRLADSEV